MAQRCLLHISKLEAFSEWLEKDGWQICDTKGFYEVLRAKKEKRWLIVYRKLDVKEHYSILDKDYGIVRSFLKSQKVKTHFDKIKSMSLEELAEFLCDNFDCDICPAYDANYCTIKSSAICKKAMEKYLESEVDA